MRSNIPLVIVSATLLLLAACSPAANTTPTGSSTVAGSPPAASAGSAACTAGASGSQTVTIQNFAFGPADVTVPAGTTVTWANKDTASHDPTADAGSFACPPISTGASASFTFSTPGTFAYHCSIHPTMTAKITVT